jgi:hypothetical protein
MNPPARPIRTELNDAVVGGIRQRGPAAVGVVIMGLARLVVAVATLAVMLFASSVLGLEVSAVPFAIMSGLSGLLSWLITRDGRWVLTVSKQAESASGESQAHESGEDRH